MGSVAGQLAPGFIVLLQKNVFITLPTGYGKSAIYQVLPLAAQAHGAVAGRLSRRQPSVLVISPLISLMHAQVTNLRRCGLQAVVIGIDQVSKEELLALPIHSYFRQS